MKLIYTHRTRYNRGLHVFYFTSQEARNSKQVCVRTHWGTQ